MKKTYLITKAVIDITVIYPTLLMSLAILVTITK